MAALVRRLAGPALLFALVTGAAAAQPRETAVLSGAFKEELKDEAPVSGRALLGLSAIPMTWAGSPYLAIHVKASTADQPVCLTIVSRDGRYFARNEYTVRAGPQDGLVQLPVGTRHPELFKKASADGLAALVENGSCAARQSAFRITRASPETDGRSIVMFANTGRADATLVVGPSEAESRFVCEPISDGKRTTFDAQCRATLPPERFANPVPLQLELCSFGECRRNRLGFLLDE